MIFTPFEEFYTELYNNPGIPHDPPPRSLLDRVHQYLEQSGVSPLRSSSLSSLNAPITEEEIQLTIKTLPSHKAPGPDGLPYEYYKSFPPPLLLYV